MQADTLAADSLAAGPAAGTAATADSLAAPDSAAGLLDALVEAVAPAAVADTGGALREMIRDVVRSEAAAPAAEPAGPFAELVLALDGVLGLGAPLTGRLLVTALGLAVLWGLRALALAAVRRRAADPRTLYRWRKTSGYVAVSLGAALLFRVWVGSLGAFATFLGLLSAGVAIALRDPLVNLAGWAFILWRHPFTPGDRITIRTHTGDVVDQRLFQFTLLEVGTKTGAGQSTGRIVHVPNGWVFSDSVVNHTGTFAYVWNEIAVTVTFESDWRAAKQILTELLEAVAGGFAEDAERTLRQAAREYFIFYTKLTPVVYTSVVPDGVQLVMRYLVAPRRVRGSEQQLWEAVLDAVAAHERIELAYPTSRVFRATEEGKPALGGPPEGSDPAEERT